MLGSKSANQDMHTLVSNFSMVGHTAMVGYFYLNADIHDSDFTYMSE